MEGRNGPTMGRYRSYDVLGSQVYLRKYRILGVTRSQDGVAIGPIEIFQQRVLQVSQSPIGEQRSFFDSGRCFKT